MAVAVNNEVCLKLGTLIETLTNSGLQTLDEDIFKKVKKICKSSQGYVEWTYELVLKQLKKKHAEVRFVALLICDELFNKSHIFREFVIKDLQLLFELTAETNPKKVLPPPKSVAVKLQRLLITCVQKWNEQYGHIFKQLHIGYNYLKHCKRVDFESLAVETAAQSVAREILGRQMEAVKKEKMLQVKAFISDNASDIAATLATLTNCISLLLPSPDNFFIVEEHPDESAINEPTVGPSIMDYDSEDEDCKEVNFRQHGLNRNVNIVLNFPKERSMQIKETTENGSIIENAKDAVKILTNSLLPQVKKWLTVSAKYGSGENNELKTLVGWKESIDKCIVKYKELNIALEDSTDSEEDDDDFEEVRKEGYEDSVVEFLPVVHGKQIPTFDTTRPNHTPALEESKFPVKPTPSTSISLREDRLLEDSQKDISNSLPCTSTSSDGVELDITVVPSTSCGGGRKSKLSHETIQEKKAAASTCEDNRKSKLLAIAPRLPYDIDLYHWEDEHLKAPTLISVKLDNPKFWGSTTVDEMAEIPDPAGAAALRTRVIEFTGEFEPVKWCCRTPLPSGMLCPRRDRVKCPFHGRIVARDDTGKCINPEDERETMKSKDEAADEEEPVPDWQDPKLLEELKAATGIDLKMPTKKGKGKKKKPAKNTNLKRRKGEWKVRSEVLKEIGKRKFPGVSTIKSREQDARTRLARKIFKRSTVNRVAQALSVSEHRKHRDKFGDQFNYMYGTS